MYKTIIETPESKAWFMADPHLGHQRDFVWESRGYTSADDHTNSVISGINEYVRPADILFIIGDLCLNTTLSQLNGYLSRIDCQNLYCLWGNHNNPHDKQIYRPERDKLCPGVQEVYPVTYRNMTYWGHYAEINVHGQMIVMFHYPLLSWNQMGHGAWALVGHEHGGLPATRPECKEGKILDVGWDLYKKPLSFEEIKAIMDTKKILGVGHHTSER